MRDFSSHFFFGSVGTTNFIYINLISFILQTATHFFHLKYSSNSSKIHVSWVFKLFLVLRVTFSFVTADVFVLFENKQENFAYAVTRVSCREIGKM